MITDSLKLNQVTALILAAVQVVVSLLEQIKAASASLHAAIDLTKAFPFRSKYKTPGAFAFTWQG